MKSLRLPAYFRGRGLLFWLMMLLVIIPGIPFVLASAGFVMYTFWPINLDRVEWPEITPTTEHVVLISHGLRDTASSWSAALAKTLDQRDGTSQVIALDWNPYSQNALRCSVDGKRIGHRFGEHVANHPGLVSIHLIGHSCGAFINLGVCRAIKEKRPDVSVQTTYLDAVSIYGGMFWDYGLNNFGACADFSDAYIDTGDDVPGSNVRLPAAHTFDVTDARLSSDYAGSPHLWPTVFYRQRAEQGQIPDLAISPDLNLRYPVGVLERIDPEH